MGKTISLECKKSIIDDYINSGLSTRKIAERYHIVNQTIYNILAEHYGGVDKIPLREPAKSSKGKFKKKNDNIEGQIKLDSIMVDFSTETKEEPKSEPKSEPKKDPVIINFAGERIVDPDFTALEVTNEEDKYFKCWLVSDRHCNGASNFGMPGIFEGSLDTKIISNIDAVSEVISKFIDKNIPKDENGNYSKTLVVYLTGIQIALSCLMVVCGQKHVPLHLMHFNNHSGEYIRQVVIGENTWNKEAEVFEKLDGNTYFYNTNSKEIYDLLCNNGQPYVIHLIDMNGESETNKQYIMCKNFDDAFKIFPRFVKASMESNDKHLIFVNSACLVGGVIPRIGYSTWVAKHVNFKDKFNNAK